MAATYETEIRISKIDICLMIYRCEPQTISTISHFFSEVEGYPKEENIPNHKRVSHVQGLCADAKRYANVCTTASDDKREVELYMVVLGHDVYQVALNQYQVPGIGYSHPSTHVNQLTSEPTTKDKLSFRQLPEN